MFCKEDKAFSKIRKNILENSIIIVLDINDTTIFILYSSFRKIRQKTTNISLYYAVAKGTNSNRNKNCITSDLISMKISISICFIVNFIDET
ncbi:hypothetical protein V1478_002153 [Vespula squamosa]|uniref:Uncharacterized protein n=1 Tax=Vespula squamosa TaxID=30214 RepID=A0ABD2BWE1_VESSQ